MFFVGGVTLPEIREAFALSKEFGADVIVGGSAILTPKRVVEIVLS